MTEVLAFETSFSQSFNKSTYQFFEHFFVVPVNRSFSWKVPVFIRKTVRNFHNGMVNSEVGNLTMHGGIRQF